MERNLKVLFNVEIEEDETSFEIQNRHGIFSYSHQACGGGGGCGGCGGCGGRYIENPIR